MKKAIIALSAATLFATAPVFAQGVSSKAPRHETRAMKAHPGGYYGPRNYYGARKVQADGMKKGYTGAYGYAPAPARDITPRWLG